MTRFGYLTAATLIGLGVVSYTQPAQAAGFDPSVTPLTHGVGAPVEQVYYRHGYHHGYGYGDRGYGHGYYRHHGYGYGYGNYRPHSYGYGSYYHPYRYDGYGGGYGGYHHHHHRGSW